MTRRDERWAKDNFTQRYQVATDGVVADVEREVLGSAWGANGYTTLAQADELGERLGLSASSRLLDIGSGRGWPGLYLAQRHSCEVVLTDLPLDGLAVARSTALARGLAGRSSEVVASARDQPFRGATFDAAVHTDVLC